jgi:hypothetical protein
MLIRRVTPRYANDVPTFRAQSLRSLDLAYRHKVHYMKTTECNATVAYRVK